MSKKNREKKEKKEKIIKLRNIEERKNAIRPIIEKLTELQLTTTFEKIKSLMTIIQTFIQDGGTFNINIPFEEINKRIKGYLTDNQNQEIWVKLEAYK